MEFGVSSLGPASNMSNGALGVETATTIVITTNMNNDDTTHNGSHYNHNENRFFLVKGFLAFLVGVR